MILIIIDEASIKDMKKVWKNNLYNDLIISTFKIRFNLKYCTGPETSFDRIFNYAMNFAQTFVNVPYFGFFWTNSISHENVNGPSLMDSQMVRKLQILKEEGVLNDTMIVFLSDHGIYINFFI